jgi:preprotein translocase subunit SecD
VVLAENPSGAKTCSTVDQLGPVFAFGEKAISSASAVIDTQTGQWVVSLTLKDGANGIDAWNTAAGQCFAKADTCKQGGMAIIIDHQVISAPVPSISVFTTTGVQITGSFSESRAKALARTLAYGATPVEMKIDTTEQVSATLGKNSLHAAIIAGIIGIGLVMIFMLLYYRSLAVIVLGGIVVSGALLWAIIAVFSRQNGLRLSLSGITGIIVSVGVTVDSYVVFFERLKDEVRGGKTLRSSALRGFRGAWRTILAADIVSLIGAVVLFQFSVGSVRGFAFFLGLSTVVDLLIAYAFTRPAVLLFAQSKRYRGGDVLGVHSGEAYAGGAA